MITTASEAFAGSSNHRMAPTLSALLNRVRHWYRRRRDLREARWAFMRTVYLEDRVLDDIGVTREEVLWAASLPIEENAALALKARAKKRRAAEKTMAGRKPGPPSAPSITSQAPSK